VEIPTIVIASRDRRARLLETLALLEALPERPPIVVVDNASRDGSADAIARAHPQVDVVRLGRDSGSAARTVGVEAARTPLVAFNDDDSWWEPGALTRAAEYFAAHPRLGLLAARIVVEPGARPDPTSAAMQDSRLPARMPLPGPAVLGFVACGAVARREAILGCGGFHPRYGFGGEEELLAVDLAAAGWGLAYADDVVAHHAPGAATRQGRSARVIRNDLWSAWLRRPLPRALRATLDVARNGDLAALAGALRGAPWILRERRVAPREVERSLRILEGSA